MAIKVIDDKYLVDIADAIRSKTGTEDTYKPTEMADAINSITIGGGGGVEMEPIVLAGDGNYACAGKIASAYIDNFGDTISTLEITDSDYMFYNNTCETIPFDININATSTYRDMTAMFSNCVNLKELPTINKAYPSGMSSMFNFCRSLRHIPEDYFNNWNFSRIQSYAYSNNANIFSGCYSLRKIPEFLLNNLWGIQTSATYVFYKSLIANCYVLDELVGLGVHKGTLTSNAFDGTTGSSNTGTHTPRLKRFTFAMNDDGTPQTANWKSQTIDLSWNIGCYTYSVNATPTNAWTPAILNQAINSSGVISHNSGITADKVIYNAETYEALKNDEDAFCIMGKSDGPKYSRYTRASAVETINSLPDTSAYLASNGGTNTIKFKGISGELTDEGAINTMTEEEIAVATAKGWTVSLV